MEFRTPEGQQRYDDLVADASRVVVGLDFDGVLSPIVPDPASAVIHADGPRTIVALGEQVLGVAVITGRPARQAIELGGFEEVGKSLAQHDRALHLLGQYGNERWSSLEGRVVSPDPPEGLDAFRAELPALLAGNDAADAFVEEKGLAIAVHTRRLQDPVGTFERLLPALTEAASRHDLGVEPGRMVIEVRAPGMHKGEALRTILGELGGHGVIFAGDDLGDIEAFRAVAEMRDQGRPGLLVCSGSEEQKALVELADIVVDGPQGVLALFRQFARDAAAASG
ncbi:MAG TPA: trehalose-phosphatase [Nocardioidaceae bacterium]|nr:trehalose-phosphatase [Nocardioidaceae bacterium]